MVNVNECEAEFQYRDSFIIDLRIENAIIDLETSADLQSDAYVTVSGMEPDKENPERIGRVQLELKGKMYAENTSGEACKYRMVIVGEFSAPATMNQETFAKMLWINGTAIMYGMARAKLETISAMVLNRGKITLPMINVIELLKKQLAEQSQTEPTDNKPDAGQN